MVEKYAVIFPGQGSQSVAMLAAYARHSQVAAAVAQASAAIDVDLQEVIKEQATLDLTINTQPALLAVCVGVYWAAADKLSNAALMAGHSLGEYAALVCADAIDFISAIRLVRRRARRMQKISGGMMAALGVSVDIVESCCEKARQQGAHVWAANYNSSGQTVIAGDPQSLEICRDLLQRQGARKIVMLPVSIPSHCPLMKPAARLFADDLREIPWRMPRLMIIHNATLKPASSPDEIIEALAAQLIHPVRWAQMFQVVNDIQQARECGPGGVLSALARRIDNAPPHVSLSSSDDIEALS